MYGLSNCFFLLPGRKDAFAPENSWYNHLGSFFLGKRSIVAS